MNKGVKGITLIALIITIIIMLILVGVTISYVTILLHFHDKCIKSIEKNRMYNIISKRNN